MQQRHHALNVPADPVARGPATLVERIDAAAGRPAGPPGRPRQAAAQPRRPPPAGTAPQDRAPPSAPETQELRDEASSPPVVETFEPDWKALAARGLPALGRPDGRSSEEIRRLTLRLRDQVAEAGSRRSILVTSAENGAGKSHVAAALALSLALDEGEYVLLVDAAPDPHPPLLGSGDGPGLAAVVAGERSLAEAARQVVGLPLWVLPAGDLRKIPNASLAGASMDRLLRKAERRRSWVIVDGPAMLEASDAAALTAKVGYVLFVAAVGRTRRDHVEAALEHVSPNQRIGLVLNRAGGRGRAPRAVPAVGDARE